MKLFYKARLIENSIVPEKLDNQLLLKHKIYAFFHALRLSQKSILSLAMKRLLKTLVKSYQQ